MSLEPRKNALNEYDQLAADAGGNYDSMNLESAEANIDICRPPNTSKQDDKAPNTAPADRNGDSKGYPFLAVD